MNTYLVTDGKNCQPISPDYAGQELKIPSKENLHA